MRRLALLLGLAVVAGCSLSLGGLGDDAPLGEAGLSDEGVDLGLQDVAFDVTIKPDGAIDASIDATGEDTRLDARPDAPPDSLPDVPPPPFCDASDPTLVACYRFEPGFTQPHDESANHNDGTSTAVTLVAGLDGSSASFDGTTSYDNVPKKPSVDVTSAITIETWFLMRSEPRTTRSGLIDEDGQWGMFVLDSNVLRCSLGGLGTYDTPAMITLGAWTHVACTYDGSVVKVFVDGLIAAEQSAKGALATTGTAGMAIGMNSPSGDVLDGMMDDLRVFRVARSDAQIAADAEKPGP